MEKLNKNTAKKSTTSKVKGEPNWLKWEEVQKKYPNQWVFLGYKKGAGSQLYDAQLDVLCTATTFEEISELEKKYSAVPTEIYKSFGLQHTQIVKPSGKKVIPIYAYTVENS